ncbi:hypothetical protein EHS13_13595 [Paenibacillus psychroresistens]|uniref:Uncharacterized protein n=1 Tax=Paenibacillus psychroresistens TaxID=1778678 RepID=A0A6B8RJ04_9BACL|nr:hypothetical protein [Paenibacillus psychroresistens]QGQ95837.1 hypothetical protein EHS13_13595 [Paenibacillus psychroresistens]
MSVILSMPQLQIIEDELRCDLDNTGIIKLRSIVTSHQNLFDANASLSFENIRLRNIEIALNDLPPLKTQSEILDWLESTTGFKREGFDDTNQH